MKSDRPLVLSVNGGSSSIKFSLYNRDDYLVPIVEGQLQKIGHPKASLSVKGVEAAHNFVKTVGVGDYAAAIELLIEWIASQLDSTLAQVELGHLVAIGHRIVHGGISYWKPTEVTPSFIKELRKLTPLDAEHVPEEIMLLEAFITRFPELKHIACFDTAFHHSMPRVAQLLPIPRRYAIKGIRRYGFHGLSCTYLIQELARLEGEDVAQGKVVLAHLGSGASVTAVAGGKSMDTSMGLTPCSGLPMGTRAGDLDPGLAWYMTQAERMNSARFHTMINYESGMLGISEISADMGVLLEHEVNDSRAADAVAFFCYQTKKWICSMAATLGGIDTLVFSGGIGENSPEVRARICSGLAFIGIELDAAQNQHNSGVISSVKSRVTVRVMDTDEERVIAQNLKQFLKIHDGN